MTAPVRSHMIFRRPARPRRGPAWLLGGAVLLAAGAAAARSAAAPLDITVTDVWPPGGHVRVDICTRETFLRDGCPYSAAAPAQEGTTTIVVPDLPPGTYAIQVYDDVNDNHRVDQGFMGVPKEGVGFSRDASVGLHGPSFESAAVTHGSEPQALSIRLRHFFHHKPGAAPEPAGNQAAR